MVHIKELRIGNLVRKGNSIVEIDLEVLKSLQTFPVRYSPIPLTKEALKKYGIILNSGFYVHEDSKYFILEDWGDFKIFYTAGEGIKLSKQLKYLHQLQNLYKALEEEELEIKE